MITLDDDAYPRRLLSLELPPPVLFVRGAVEALEAAITVAVVGTRQPTEAGRRIAGRISSAISRLGGVVVSGLAVGIDGAAHAAAVAERRPTVAVLGSGHGALYPRAHARVAEAIVAEGGAVVSELGPDVSGNHGTFPRRNRLISGLAIATVVVEAGPRSGALITAGWALEQGRECFIVPGSIDAPTSAGCLQFLHSYQGQARIVPGVRDLLEDLGLFETPGPDGRRSGSGTRRPGGPAGRSPAPRGRHRRCAGRGHGPAGGNNSERADPARDARPGLCRLRPVPCPGCAACPVNGAVVHERGPDPGCGLLVPLTRCYPSRQPRRAQGGPHSVSPRRQSIPASRGGVCICEGSPLRLWPCRFS